MPHTSYMSHTLRMPSHVRRARFASARLPSAAAVLLAHGVVMALVWQANPPPSGLAAAPARSAQRGVLYMLQATAQPAGPAAVLRFEPEPAKPTHEASPKQTPPAALNAAKASPAETQPAPALAAVPVKAPAASAPPAPPGLPAAGVDVATTFSRLASHSAADGSASLPPAPAHSPQAHHANYASPKPWPSNALPRYPEAAREDGLEGSVGLSVMVDAQGQVQRVQWVQRSGYALLDQAARDAVATWRFTPAQYEGTATAGVLTLAIRFQLNAPPQAVLGSAQP